MLSKIASNWGLLALSILTTLFLVPFNLYHLGREQYGLWLVIAALTAYLNLLQLGVPMASVRSLATAIGSKDQAAVNRLATSYGVFYLWLAGATALIGLPMLALFGQLYAIPADLLAEAHVALGLAVLTAVIGFPSQLPQALLESHQEFERKNVIGAALVVVRTALNIAIVLYHPTLLALAIVALIGAVLEFGAYSALVVLTKPQFRLRLSLFDVADIRQVLAFSFYVFLLTAGSQLAYQTATLIAGYALGPEDVPLFAVPNSLVFYLLQFITGISAVIMPMATVYHVRGQRRELIDLFETWSKRAMAIACCAAVYLLAFGPDLLARWVGPDFEGPAAAVLRILILSQLLFLPMRGVAMPILMAMGKARHATFAMLGMGVLTVILCLLLVKPYGLNGLAWGVSLPHIAMSGALLVLVCRELGLSVRTALARLLPLPAMAFMLALGVTWILRAQMRPTTWFELGVAGVATVAIFAAIWVPVLFRAEAATVLAAVSARLNHPLTKRTLRGPSMPGLKQIAGAALFGLALIASYLAPITAIGVLCSLAVLAFCGVAAELAARWFLSHRAPVFIRRPFTRFEMQPDRSILPMLSVRALFSTNEAGARGPALRAARTQQGGKTLRMLAVGGSAVECFTLDDTEAWPAVLEAQLNAGGAQKLGAERAVVWNTGCSGITTDALLFALPHELPRFEPLDAVFVMIGASAVNYWTKIGTPSVLPEPDAPWSDIEWHGMHDWAWQPRTSALAEVIRRQYYWCTKPVGKLERMGRSLARSRKMRANAREVRDRTGDPAAWLANFEATLTGVVELARKHARHVILIRQPWFDKPNPTPEEMAMFWHASVGDVAEQDADTYYSHRVFCELMRLTGEATARVGEATDCVVLDPLSAIEPSTRTFYDQAHFTPEGARLVGEYIAAQLLERFCADSAGSPAPPVPAPGRRSAQIMQLPPRAVPARATGPADAASL